VPMVYPFRDLEVINTRLIIEHWLGRNTELDIPEPHK